MGPDHMRAGIRFLAVFHTLRHQLVHDEHFPAILARPSLCVWHGTEPAANITICAATAPLAVIHTAGHAGNTVCGQPHVRAHLSGGHTAAFLPHSRQSVRIHAQCMGITALDRHTVSMHPNSSHNYVPLAGPA